MYLECVVRILKTNKTLVSKFLFFKWAYPEIKSFKYSTIFQLDTQIYQISEGEWELFQLPPDEVTGIVNLTI